MRACDGDGGGGGGGGDGNAILCFVVVGWLAGCIPTPRHLDTSLHRSRIPIIKSTQQNRV
ncbi:hypothetical protein EJ05DRAFT_480004 [Pseudovirgaria hyperparasitica]|uniref:Uncharacterized protein n=1 Tax=Pseudovirgaria hyperparasitica TaxID=470096 RepID=A0A6A6VXK7_9PEZI|nr:uncharacterized protein EJ05DRAFT_480004 [Pseudovirgaria hyperparasitica]KAF2753991.1 hypothetical protein EJ05DRAFT_480004 [Pseudovirgaria hyperparasitica]